LGLRSKLRPARERPKKGVCPACGRGYHEHFREPPVAGQHFHPLPLSGPQVSFRPVRPVLPDINGMVSDVMARVYTINRHVLRHHLTPPSLRVAMPDFDGILDRLPDPTNLKIPDIGKCRVPQLMSVLLTEFLSAFKSTDQVFAGESGHKLCHYFRTEILARYT
jgi:hypothetical protein